MAAGYARSTGQVGVCAGDFRPGRHQHGHAGARLHGRFDPDRGDLRPGAARRHRHRRLPGSARRGASWAPWPSTCSWSPTRPSSKETMRTAFELARTGRPGPVVVDIPKDVQNWPGSFQGAGMLVRFAVYRRRAWPSWPRIPSAASSWQPSSNLLAASQRPLIYAGGGVINGEAATGAARVRVEALRHPGRDDADGHRRHRHHRPAAPAHARHARHRVRQLRRRGLRFPDRGRRALRRPRRRQPAEVRARRARTSRSSTSIAPRSTRSSTCSGATSATCRTHCAACIALVPRARGGRPDFAPWHADLAALRQRYAMNYDRDSELIQP